MVIAHPIQDSCQSVDGWLRAWAGMQFERCVVGWKQERMR